jgi:hypothetical protein
VLCRWLQSLSIALWMGAILCLGMIVAPYAVTYFNSRVDAGKFLGPLFYKLTLGGVICGVVYVLLLLVHDSLWKRYHPTAVGGILTFLRFVLAVGMVGASAYLLIRAYPAMEQYQKVAQVVNGAFTGGAGRAFDYWHALYKTITSSVFGAGLALLLLTHMSHKRR